MALLLGIAAVRRRPEPSIPVARGIFGFAWRFELPIVVFPTIVHARGDVGLALALALAAAGLACAGLVMWSIGGLIPLNGPQRGTLTGTAFSANTGYMGLPLAATLLGSQGLHRAIVYDALLSGPALFVGVVTLGLVYGTTHRERPSLLRALLLSNPALLAAIAGVVAPTALAPGWLVSLTQPLVIAMAPLGFFAVGVLIGRERLRLPSRLIVTAVGVRVLVAPLILVICGRLGAQIPTSFTLQAAMPCGVNNVTVADRYGMDSDLAATAVLWSSLVVLVAASVYGLLR